MTLRTWDIARTALKKGSDRPATDQARARAAARLFLAGLPLALALGGCATPAQINPRALGRDISGAAQDARLPPPGMDRPTPNLASVPPIPERPDLAAREALTRRLEAERGASREEIPVGRAQAPLNERDAPGQPPIPARPPAPPSLAAAPAIPWTPPRVAPPTPAASERGARPPELLAPEGPTPGEIPALPAPELLAPAAPVPGEAGGSPAPSAVPPPPSPDLLAPPAR